MRLLALALLLVMASAPARADEGPDALSRARALYAELAYEDAIAAAREALRMEGLPREARAEAHLLLGASLVVVGQTLEAEEAFRALLREQPGFLLPDHVEPKIEAVFRKVEAEERARRELELREARAALRERILVEGGPAPAKAGLPIAFSIAIGDPDEVVAGVRIDYRREGERDYYSVPLAHDADGTWTGEIPASWTAREVPYVVEWTAAAVDARGEVVDGIGDRAVPERLAVVEAAPGTGALPPVIGEVMPKGVRAAYASLGAATGLLAGALLGGGVAFLAAFAVLDTPEAIQLPLFAFTISAPVAAGASLGAVLGGLPLLRGYQPWILALASATPSTLFVVGLTGLMVLPEVPVVPEIVAIATLVSGAVALAAPPTTAAVLVLLDPVE